VAVDSQPATVYPPAAVGTGRFRDR